MTQVFQTIEDQTDFHFFYNSQELNVRQRVVFSATDKPVVDVLQSLFGNSSISYNILGNQIVLKKVQKSTQPPSITARQLEQQPVTGTITDRTGMPMAGVTDLIEGTNKGTVTNFDGQFSITLEEGQNVLVFSSLGYKTERFEVNGNTTINLVMTEDLSQLEEVVLIGYGEQKREDVTGAISSVETQDIVQASVGNIGFDRALGGLVKGVQVSQGSGRLGAPVRLNIRGITSPLSSYGLNQPLYVIDGVPFNIDAVAGTNPLLTLNPNDIESFDILKDAPATSIYGSRGANGVIIIATKRGKRAWLTVVGDFQKEKLFEMVNTYFGKIPAASHIIPQPYTEEPPQYGPRKITVRKAGETSVISVAYKIPGTLHEDVPALIVLAQALGSGPSSVLNKEFVDTGLTFYAFASASQFAENGLFSINLGFDPQKDPQKLNSQLIETLERVKSQGIPQPILTGS